MKTDTLTAQVLPEFGGKISSLRYGGVELLQPPLRPYAARDLQMGFEESDASGFDECLPTIAPCNIDFSGVPVPIPDHGEIWRLPCKADQRSATEIHLTATGSVLPLRLNRILKLTGDTLRVDYRLQNVGEVEVPYLWAAHPLYIVEEGDSVTLPPSVNEVKLESSAHDHLGVKGDLHRWPNATLKSGKDVDLSRVGNVRDDIGDMLYARAPQEGWAEIARAQAGLRLQVRFDAALTPYLGLWLCYGGWPQGYAARQQCVAIEACTAPCGSLAEAMQSGWARNLAPGQSDSWWMSITVSGLKQ